MERNRSVAMPKCLRESISGSENSQFKGPEVGASMLSEASVDGMKVSSSEGHGVDNGLNH